MDLPIYELLIEDKEADDAEVSYVALVDKPAIQRDFIAFKEATKFQVVSETEHILSGPLMIADQLIYRNNDKFGEHYVKFSTDTIKSIAIQFAKKGFQKNVNIMHEASMQVEGVTMFESFIVDKKRGIMPMKGFEDVADGSWFGSFYVENEEVWNAVKDGNLKGFSVEGLFDYVKPKMTAEKMIEKLSALLNVTIE